MWKGRWYNARIRRLTEQTSQITRRSAFPMATTSPHEVTQLLVDWSNGNQAALDRLMPLGDRELQRLAHHYMRQEKPGHTLQTTALVNEAYLRLVDQKSTLEEPRALLCLVRAVDASHSCRSRAQAEVFQAGWRRAPGFF